MEDGSVYYYTVSPYDLKNFLGHSIAILQEYLFIKRGDENGYYSCKLYKTKDGNWYDFEDQKASGKLGFIRQLKSAIDERNKAVFE